MIENVAVVGAGLMGHALALVHALAGCEVRLQDVSGSALAAAPGLIRAALRTLVEADACSEADAARAEARVTYHEELATVVAGAELIVEAVVENAEVKRQVFAELDRLAGADAIIASNTSHLDVFPLIPPGRQAKALIAHWYTPPYIVDLVDLVRGPTTDPAIVERLRDFYAGLGKRPVVFETMLQGYVANRLQAAINQEIFHLLDEGKVTAEAIDTSIKHGLGLRLLLMGQVKKIDYTGLDMVRRALANGSYHAPPPTSRSTSLDRLVADGKNGASTGAGFYDYDGRSAVELFEERDRKLLALKRAWQAIGEL